MLRIALGLICVGTMAEASSIAGGNCPTIPSPAGTYAKIAPANGQPARCFFCGNVRKYQANGTMTPAPLVLEQDPSTGYVYCNNDRDGNHPDRSGQLLELRATETAEIRGWIVGVGGPHDTEDEFEFDIMPDIG